MAVPTLQAVTPVGTFTRKTLRPYEFVVVARGRSREAIDASFATEKKHNEELLAKYEAVLAAGVVPAEYRRSSSLQDYEGYAARVREQLATHADRLEAAQVAAGSAPFWCVGWSSHLYLARRERDRIAAQGYQDAQVYEIASGKEVR
jgi:hypothetical protein